MGLLIDSSVLIAIERGRLTLEALIKERVDEQAFLSVISASELLHGVYRAADAKTRSRRLAFVEGILSTFPVLELDLTTARLHAQLWSDLSQQGVMIGLHDSWLAATCLANGLTIATGNAREFKRVPGLNIEVWPR